MYCNTLNLVAQEAWRPKEPGRWLPPIRRFPTAPPLTCSRDLLFVFGSMTTHWWVQSHSEMAGSWSPDTTFLQSIRKEIGKKGLKRSEDYPVSPPVDLMHTEICNGPNLELVFFGFLLSIFCSSHLRLQICVALANLRLKMNKKPDWIRCRKCTFVDSLLLNIH